MRRLGFLALLVFFAWGWLQPPLNPTIRGRSYQLSGATRGCDSLVTDEEAVSGAGHL